MAHSSLLGTEPAAAEPAGRDTAALGPSDSSDSGSDVAGALPAGDPGLAVDVAMRDDTPHSLRALDMLTGNATDTAGTGERRGAVADAGREGADIGVDHIVGATGVDEVLSDDEVEEGDDEGTAAEEGEEGAFEDEDDGIPKGRRSVPPMHAHRPPIPTPDHPNPEPDTPAPMPDDEDAGPPGDDRDNRERHPVRAALLRP